MFDVILAGIAFSIACYIFVRIVYAAPDKKINIFYVVIIPHLFAFILCTIFVLPVLSVGCLSVQSLHKSIIMMLIYFVMLVFLHYQKNALIDKHQTNDT